MDRLHVATLNILNLADRWPERLPLLLADMAALQPDLLGLQEVVYVMQQDRLIGAAGEGRYGAVRGWAGRPEYGNSLLVREPLAASRRRPARPRARPLGASGGRGAARAARPCWSWSPTSTTRWTATPQRDEQAAALLGWLDEAPRRPTRSIAMGDFNADPAEPTYARMRAAGFVSAYAEANGAEPAVTWPSGLQAPAMDTDGDPDCLDYIWLRGAVRVVGCPAGLRPARPARSDGLPERPPRASARTSRSGRRGCRSAPARSGSPIGATGATPRRTASRR